MIPEAAWSLLPADGPPESEPWVSGLIERANLSTLEARAYRWAMHLLGRLSDRAIVTAIMGNAAAREAQFPLAVMDLSAGFIPFKPERSAKDGSLRSARLSLDVPVVTTDAVSYSFGIVVGIEPPTESMSNRSDADMPSQVVSIEGFPIVVEYREIAYDGAPSPLGATSACYAKPRSSKRFLGPMWSDGIVIARHSLAGIGFAAGRSVPMAHGGSCIIADIDSSTTIDAAILDCGALPSSVTPLLLAAAVAPGMQVTVRAASASLSAQVLRVNDHPNYYGNLMAHRLFLDTVGTRGDSGSLVLRSRPYGDCTGLYMGSTGGSVPEGLVQSMRQVVHYFDIDLYD